MKSFLSLVAALLVVMLPGPVSGCTLCGIALNRPTLGVETQQSAAVFYGEAVSSQITNQNIGLGTTDITILDIVKPHAGLAGKKIFQVDAYFPIVDRKNPPRFLVFLQEINGQLRLNRGKQVNSPAAVAYLRESIRLASLPRREALLSYFRYLNHEDRTVAEDAFLEFARSSDQEVGDAARQLEAAAIRKLLNNPATPTHQFALLAFLLGACGGDEDAALLHEMISRPTARYENAIDGLLCGYIALRPRAGWDLTAKILADRKRSLTQRIAATRTLKFYQGWKPVESRPELVRCLGIVLDDPETVDLAIEDMRRWEIWDHAARVLALYHSKEQASPILRRGIIRYALCCPREEARKLVEAVRRTDPEMVQDLEEQVGRDRKSAPSSRPKGKNSGVQGTPAPHHLAASANKPFCLTSPTTPLSLPGLPPLTLSLITVGVLLGGTMTLAGFSAARKKIS